MITSCLWSVAGDLWFIWLHRPLGCCRRHDFGRCDAKCVRCKTPTIFVRVDWESPLANASFNHPAQFCSPRVPAFSREAVPLGDLISDPSAVRSPRPESVTYPPPFPIPHNVTNAATFLVWYAAHWPAGRSNWWKCPVLAGFPFCCRLPVALVTPCTWAEWFKIL